MSVKVGKRKVVAKPKEVEKTEIELYNSSRRIPIEKFSVYRVVFTCLDKYHSKGKIHDLKFEEVNAEVRKRFPDSKFNPFHFAHYKHKFLIEAI